MVVYRLTRSPERRVFYIDMGSIQHHKAESLIERMKDQMRKKKTFSGRGGQAAGASSVEERWHAPAADEDIWLPTRPNSNTRVETLPGACLALDTKIPLLDGRILTLAEIIKEREEGKQNWVYSCNPENGAFAPGRITWAGVTRRNTDVVRITFDNGESVVCTPDHKFPIIGKGKVQAKDLLIGESMIPFNTRMAKMPPKFKYDYLQLYDVNKKEWEFVHRLVGKYVINTKFYQEHVFSELYKNERKGVLHHYDFNRFNNSPENLFWMNWNDHKVLHRTMPDNVREKMRQSLIKFHEKLDSSDPFYDRLRASAKKGSESLCEKLLDENYNKEFCRKQSQGWIKAKETNPELHKARGEKISKRNLNYWSNPNNKKEVFAKQTVNYPQEIFDYFVELLKEGKLIEEIIPLINDEKLIKKYIEANQHIKRNVDFSKGLAKDNINKMVKAYGFSGIRQLRKSLDTDKTPSNFNGGRKKGGGLKYPKVIMDIFMKYLSEGKSVTESLKLINSNQELLSLFNKAKEGIGYKTDLTGLMTSGHALKMVKHFGYEGLTHAREQASFYNHKVVKVEFLTEKIDTGTITVDGNHELHDYHTFAISPCGVYTCNSNLGDIDDAIYFRRKLLIALNMPQNYMSPEDPSITAKTLSVQNVTFAKFVERLQMSLEDGLLELLERHLRLRGFPQDTFDDLELIMTPPSAYREMSEQEVQALRYANAGAMAGQMAQYDIFVEIMKIPEAKAKELAMRAKMQKIEDAKIQAMVSNPEYVGVGQMGNEGTELGGEAGGPNPMLGPQPPQGNQPPPPPSPPSDGAEGNAAGNAAGGPLGREKKPDAQPLPNPTDQDLKKYDLEIRDYSLEKDEEEIDPVSLGE
jgi:intein/homing endonuclease